MKIKLVITLLLNALFISPAFANHGVDAMGDGIMLVFIFGFIALISSVISIRLSYKAYRHNRTSHKIIATILTIPIGVCGILLFQFEIMPLAFVALLVVLTNMLLILNAKPQKESTPSIPFPQGEGNVDAKENPDSR